MTLTPIARSAWADLGGEPDLLDLVSAPTPPVALSASMDVAGLLADSSALATLALQEVQVARGQRTHHEPFRCDGNRIRTAAQSERHLRIDAVAPQVWAPLSGFWKTSDGWVRTHGNYPHHAERLAALLGIRPDADPETVAAAVASRGALELEDQAARTGAVLAMVRHRTEWAAHPQARALAEQPLIRFGSTPSPARAWAGPGARPLDGVRVLDLTRVIAGPSGTRTLAFAGADVLRVDSALLPEISWQHLDTGAGKRSTTLDLTSAHGRRNLQSLLAAADVVVTGYRPSALDRFGLDADTLSRTHPGLVLACVSAWGTDGPWASRRGFDSIVQAVSGIALRQSADGSTPGALPAQALDHAAGHLLATSVCRALVLQRNGGGSWHCQVALARIAQELLETRPTAVVDDEALAPTLQHGTTAAGQITCAAPPLTYRGGFALYPSLAAPWGSDPPAWI